MLDAQKVAMELIEGLREIVARVRTGSPDLADQMRRAATSVALNVAEGTRRQGRDKKRVYRIAAAEAQELKTALTVAAAWGDVEAERIAAVLALAERLGGGDAVRALLVAADAARAPGGPGALPPQGSHRSGLAGFPHPAPQATGSLGATLRGGRGIGSGSRLSVALKRAHANRLPSRRASARPQWRSTSCRNRARASPFPVMP